MRASLAHRAGDAPRRNPKPTPGNAKPGTRSQVLIKVSTRGKRKHVTMVSGLDAYLPPGQTLKTVAKLMATRFACSASVGL